MNKYLSQFESIDDTFGLRPGRHWLDKSSTTEVENWQKGMPEGQNVRNRLVPKGNPPSERERLQVLDLKIQLSLNP